MSESQEGISIKDRVSHLFDRWKKKPIVQSTAIEPNQIDPIQNTYPAIEKTSNIEVEPIIPQVYVGLEKLDELIDPERTLKGGFAISEGDRKQEFQEMLNEIEEKRQAIFKKCDAVELVKQENERLGVNPYTGEPHKLDDAKSLSYLLIEKAASELPKVKDGYVRMYRGEGPHPGRTDDDNTGKWFSPDLNISKTAPFGPLKTSRMIFIDIPQESLKHYSVEKMRQFTGASKGGEYLLSRWQVSQAKEFIRFLEEGTQGDPWAKETGQEKPIGA
jgi:hypothetical protein